jgi:hypothetical protein
MTVELDDWLAAEVEVDHMLANGKVPTPCGQVFVPSA